MEIFQPKNLNIPIEEFMKIVVGCRILSIKGRGKWLFLELSGAQFLLINLGMGGELLYFSSGDTLPGKYKFKLQFVNGSGFTINFWWFGYIHLIDKMWLKNHKMTGALGCVSLPGHLTV